MRNSRKDIKKSRKNKKNSRSRKLLRVNMGIRKVPNPIQMAENNMGPETTEIRDKLRRILYFSQFLFFPSQKVSKSISILNFLRCCKKLKFFVKIFHENVEKLRRIAERKKLLKIQLEWRT